jgi:toxin ParE1/3/4
MKKYNVVLSRNASRRIVEIHDGIEEHSSSKKASYVVDAIMDKIDTLETFPKRNVVVPELEKKGVFRKVFQWTYNIIYNVDDKKDMVKVATVYDGRRSPKKLLEELE